jgi:hypothetical protein
MVFTRIPFIDFILKIGQIIDLNSTVILRELIRKNDVIVTELLTALIEILESRKSLLSFFSLILTFVLHKRHSKRSSRGHGRGT